MTEIAKGDSSIAEDVKNLLVPKGQGLEATARAGNTGVDIEEGSVAHSKSKAKGETRFVDDEETDILTQIRQTETTNQSSDRDTFQNIRDRAKQLLARTTHTSQYTWKSVPFDEQGEGHELTHRATRDSTLARATSYEGYSTGRQTANAWNAIGDTMGDWMEDDAIVFTPWKDDAKEAMDYVKHLDQQRVLSTWGALYCGGQGPLAEALKKTTKEFNATMEAIQYRSKFRHCADRTLS